MCAVVGDWISTVDGTDATDTDVHIKKISSQESISLTLFI